MKTIEWDPKYAVGIDEVDLQHKDFIKIIARIQAGLEKKYPQEMLVRLCRELWQYTLYHFLSESNLMYIADYPNRGTHEHEHKKLLDVLQAHLDKVGQGVQSPDAFSRFLLNWLVNHIYQEDKLFAHHVLNRALGGRSPS